MKQLIVISDGVFHPPVMGRAALHNMLGAAEGFALRRVRSFESLPGVAGLGDCSAIVVYLHHRTIGAGALKVFEEYVRNGGGVLAIHSATASFKQQARYFEILGGRFVGHGRVGPLAIEPASARGNTGGDKPFQGLPGFEVRDELYLHETSPRIDVHFVCAHEGAPVPVVWTCRHGAGRVCYAAPGHVSATMRNRAYQRVLLEGLAWVSG